MKVLSSRVHRTEHRVHLNGEQLEQIVAETVAKAAGVKLGAPGVHIRRVSFNRVDRGTRGFVTEAEVELVEDHTPRGEDPTPDRQVAPPPSI